MKKKKKKRLYIDTSVISHLYSRHAPLFMLQSWVLWVSIMNDEYEIVLSDVVINEIKRCRQPKRRFINKFLEKIKFSLINVNDEIKSIANEVVGRGILNEKKYNDCLHIAVAVYNKCDYLLSWNLDDLVKIKTIKGVRNIASLLGHKDIDIITPETFKEMEAK